jgi:Minor capsid protein
MVKVKPIPKKLLPHTIEYERFTGEGRNGPTYDMAVTVKNVRMEPTSEKSIDNNGEQIQLKSKLFIDAVNSSPLIDLKEKSVVHFDEKDYYVQSIATFYTNTVLVHHWELGLV